MSSSIPPDGPRRRSLGAVVRNAAIFICICGMIAATTQWHSSRLFSLQPLEPVANVEEVILRNIPQQPQEPLESPLQKTVKHIREHRRLNTVSEDQAKADEYHQIESTRRLKGKGYGRNRYGYGKSGYGYGRNGSPYGKSRSSGKKGGRSFGK